MSVSYTHLDVYKRQIFNLPYLFNSPEHYHAVMDNKELIKPIFTSTEKSGFEAVAWLDAGTRNSVSYTHLDVYKRQELF